MLSGCHFDVISFFDGAFLKVKFLCWTDTEV